MWINVRRRIVSFERCSKNALLPSILIYILGAFGSVCMSSTTIYLMEQAVCRTHYTQAQPTAVGPGGLMDEEMCKLPEIQSQVASSHGVYKVLALLPALFLTGPYGRISEVLGKRLILVLNLSSVTLRGLYFTGVFYFQLPVKLIYISPCFDIIGGGTVIMSSFIYSYIAEAIESKDLCSMFYKLTAAQLIVSFVGMTLSSWLLRNNVWVLCVMGIVSFCLCVPSTLLYPQFTSSSKPTHGFAPPKLADEISADTATALRVSSDRVANTGATEPESKSSETTSLLSSSSSSSTIKVASAATNSASCLKHQPRKNQSTLSTILHALTTQYLHSLTVFQDIYNSSLLSRITLITYFIIVTSLSISVIFIQWASVTFGWIIADVNTLTSFELIVSGTVLVSLPILCRRFLFPRLGNRSSRVDIFIAKVSIAVHALGLLGMGFAPNKIAYISATTVWTIGIGWNDSLRSFVTGMVDGKEEVDKLYLGIGMIETCGGMVGTAGWSAAYATVVGEGYFVKRVLFIAGSTLLTGSLGGLLWLGRIARGKRNTRV